MARLLTLAAVVGALVSFMAEVTDSSGWWIYALGRGSHVLLVLALAAALLSERRPSGIVLGAQVAAAATAIAFMTVALVKYYEKTSSVGRTIASAYTWANEAQVFGLAALAFALTLSRRRSVASMGALALAGSMAVGSGIYAITQKETFTAGIWWWLATVGALLAASAAAGLERRGE